MIKIEFDDLLKKYEELYCAFWCATKEEFQEYIENMGWEKCHKFTIDNIRLQNREYHRMIHKK